MKSQRTKRNAKDETVEDTIRRLIAAGFAKRKEAADAWTPETMRAVRAKVHEMAAAEVETAEAAHTENPLDNDHTAASLEKFLDIHQDDFADVPPSPDFIERLGRESAKVLKEEINKALAPPPSARLRQK
jgi:hypothetical protein